MKAVFLDRATFSNSIELTPINQQVGQLDTYLLTSPSEVIERSAEAEIIVTNKVVINDEIMAELPALKLICVAATGTNNIDLEAAKKRGITVCNASDYAGPSVSQYIFSQLLNHFQNINHHNKNVIDGKWASSTSFCFLGNPIQELAGKTLGLVGYGHIAQQVEKIAIAFGMDVLIAERPGATAIRTGRLPFTEVLSRSDILSLHCPLTEQTKHLMNTETFGQCKKGAILVNTARGQIVEEHALLDALTSGQLSVAMLDVLSTEPPPPESILLKAQPDNLVITAHMAWASQQAQQRLIRILGENIESFLAGSPLNVVNK
ncbi:D-2-hydroxyacid dehydrogenase [Thalassotalea euphylliae]|uniref:D-2-hydroxyacid dehydrogenase n=1 Tax=Thalassotalea euphylliae TaxID=1655234 RepID=UPI00363E5091